MKHGIFHATLLASLMAAAGAAMAQATSIPAQPDPAVGGQASTQTPSGVPNPPQRPDSSMPNSREAVKAEARAHNRNNANNLVPKGEASTTVNAQPNAMPQPTGEMSRAEVSQATGVLVAQLEVEPAEALLRLRAHAYATGRAATDVARDIIERRLRLDDR